MEKRRFNTFEGLADWYNKKYTEMGDGWECPESVALEYLSFMGITEKQDKLLLDFGCGAGHFIQTAQKFVNCVGMDLSEVAIEKARKRVPEASFMVENVELLTEIPTYDYVVSLGSVEHTLSIANAMLTINGLLKDDGRVFMLVPNEEWVHVDQPNETTLTDDKWKFLFNDTGFEVLDFKRQGDISLFLLGKLI